MTTERRLARAGFTLTRDYPVPLERVWDAFAEEDQKLRWWGAGDDIEPGEWVFDFRVGGRDVAEGKFHDGPVSRYEATYTDIVEHVRIVTTYDMWLDGIHMSTSVASFEFEPIDERHPVHPRRARRVLRPVLGRRGRPRGRHPGPARGAGRLPGVELNARTERWLSRQSGPAAGDTGTRSHDQTAHRRRSHEPAR